MLIAGNGGWPMSSFLTFDGKPFFGGTYYPPEAFADQSLRVANAWATQRDGLIAQGKTDRGCGRPIIQSTNRGWKTKQGCNQKCDARSPLQSR